MAFFFTILFMVCVFWRPQDWLIPVLFDSGYLNALVAVATFALMLDLDTGALRRPKNHQIMLLTGLYVAVLMSHIAHTNFALFVDTISPAFKPSFYGLLLLTVLDRIRRLRIVMLVFSLMAILMSVHALLQASRGYGFNGQRPMLLLESVRTIFFGCFADPNDLAQILVTCVPLVFALPRRLNLFTLCVCGSAAGVMVVATSTTGSDGARVGLVVGAAWMVMGLLPRRWIPGLVVSGLTGALLLCTIAGGMLDDSAISRLNFWGAANQAFKTNPVFGIGQNQLPAWTAGHAVHNSFVQCYAELGYFGYWFWIGLAIVAAMGCYRARLALSGIEGNEARYLRRLATLLSASLATFLATSYFLTRAFTYPYVFLVAVLMGFANTVEPMIAADKRPLIDFKRDVVGLVTAGSALSIVYIYVSILLLNRAGR